jgi:NADH-quinone oxidoreductase subunit M
MGHFPGILTFITFFPLLGAIIVLLIPKDKKELIRWVSLIVTFIPLVVSFYIYANYDFTLKGVNDPNSFQFVEKVIWIPKFNIWYYVGVDGISITMVILTAIITFIGVISSWTIDRAVKSYFALYLLLATGMMGVFVALDLFLFYVFWEVMLLPMYFLIGIWGSPANPRIGSRGREYSAIKFFLYTLFGSMFMLIVMLLFYFETGSFSIPELSQVMIQAEQTNTFPGKFLSMEWVRIFAWLGFWIAFAIKVPSFPFHTWLPDAHVDAPTPISVILAGVLLKMGTYGFLRINYPMLPAETKLLAPFFLGVIGVINIVYGALVAMAQRDFKKLIAYSSISHMGYVMLGMASFTIEGMNGALFQMFNHGTITAMFFLLVGVIYDRAHHREIDLFGGLAKQMPKYAAFTAFAFFAGLGLPGLSGFISEVLVFLGAFKTYRTLTIIAATGVILTAAYLLWAYLRIFLGEFNEKYANLPDINTREVLSLIPVAIFVLWFGVYPSPYIKTIQASMDYLKEIIEMVPMSMTGILGNIMSFFS